MLDHYLHGDAAPAAGGADHLRRRLPRQPRNAAPVLQRYGYPAVVFVPVGYLARHAGRCRTTSTSPRAGSSTRRSHWEELAELESYGVRVESHGIGHRPLADLEVDEAAREITLSKLRLEERLGRPVRAFAYVKGSEAHYRLVHLSLLKQAGYDVAFTSVSGSNGPATDPLQLHRYNVEPYPSRTFELVLAGACDLIAVKDTVAGHARAPHLQRGARHVHASELATSSSRTTRRDRDDYVALLGEAWGDQGLTRGGVRLVVRARTRRAACVRSRASTARSSARRRAHARAGWSIGGEERSAAFACHAVTLAGRARPRHLHRRSQRAARGGGAGARRRASSSASRNAVTNPMFFGRLGWSDVAHYRIWVRPGPPARRDAAAGRAWTSRATRPPAGRTTSSATSSYLAWRFVDSPRAVRHRSARPTATRSSGRRSRSASRTIAVLSDLAAPAKEIRGLLRRAAGCRASRVLFGAAGARAARARSPRPASCPRTGRST